MSVVGIDIGTAAIRTAINTDRGIELVRGPTGESGLAAAVFFDPEQREKVGQAAFGWGVARPDCLVYGVKGLIGRTPEQSAVRRYSKRTGLDVAAGADGSILLQVGGARRSPHAIASLLVGAALGMAEQRLGRPPMMSVVGLPPAFRGPRVRALRAAVLEAGLVTVRLASETVAAAAAVCPLERESRTVALVNVGASQTTVAILRVGDGETPVELAVAYEEVAGDDVDDVLVEVAAQQLGLGSPGPAHREALRQACELGKRNLSQAPEALCAAPVGPSDAERSFTLTRRDLGRACADVFVALDSCCIRARREAGREALDLAEVHAVGGMARSPLVLTKIADLFGQEPTSSRMGVDAVAAGALVLAPQLGLDAGTGRPATVPPAPRPSSSARPSRPARTAEPPGAYGDADAYARAGASELPPGTPWEDAGPRQSSSPRPADTDERDRKSSPGRRSRPPRDTSYSISMGRRSGRGSRAPEPARRGSRAPEPARRGSRAPEPGRTGSRAPEEAEHSARASKTPGGRPGGPQRQAPRPPSQPRASDLSWSSRAEPEQEVSSTPVLAGAIENPKNAAEFLSMPMGRPLSGADLEAVPLPSLLIWLAGQTDGSGVLTVDVPHAPRLVLNVGKGKVESIKPLPSGDLPAFAQPRGTYSFERMDVGTLGNDANGIVAFVVDGLKAMARGYTLAEIEKTFGGRYWLAPLIPSGKRRVAEKMGLASLESDEIRSSFDGSRTCRDIVARAGTERHKVAQLLLVFTVFGLVDFRPPTGGA